ncbi:MAG: Cupin domain protein, partial [uncultured Gemmatimonadetes bacterium]
RRADDHQRAARRLNRASAGGGPPLSLRPHEQRLPGRWRGNRRPVLRIHLVGRCRIAGTGRPRPQSQRGAVLRDRGNDDLSRGRPARGRRRGHLSAHSRRRDARFREPHREPGGGAERVHPRRIRGEHACDRRLVSRERCVRAGAGGPM